MQYITHDLQFGAYADVLGFEPVNIEGPSHRRMMTFDVPEEVVSDFYKGRGQVAPRVLFSSYYKVVKLVKLDKGHAHADAKPSHHA